jgi:hypothetical protein
LVRNIPATIAPVGAVLIGGAASAAISLARRRQRRIVDLGAERCPVHHRDPVEQF